MKFVIFDSIVVAFICARIAYGDPTLSAIRREGLACFAMSSSMPGLQTLTSLSPGKTVWTSVSSSSSGRRKLDESRKLEDGDADTMTSIDILTAYVIDNVLSAQRSLFTTQPSWCSFQGVSCGTVSGTASYANVMSIDLYGLHLSGSIPALVGNFQSMIKLSLAHNHLVGTIPDSIGTITSLVHLFLYSNSLVGTIPTSISGLRALQTLGLSANSLAGTIPAVISALISLYSLDLKTNAFTGTIPSSIGELTNLEALDLYYNSLTGTIPSQMSLLTKMKYLELRYNYLTVESATTAPTLAPTLFLSSAPTATPTSAPSATPTAVPISGPSVAPTRLPTLARTHRSTRTPSSAAPSVEPTPVPTIAAGSPTPKPTSATPTLAPTQSPTYNTVTMVVVPVVEALVGVTQATLQGSPYAQTAFKNSVASTIGSIQGASPNVTITGYAIYARRALVEAQLSSVYLRDVNPTGVQVKYNIVFTYNFATSVDKIAMLMASVNANLTRSTSLVGGGASAFSTMLVQQFLNVTEAAGSNDANVFSGVTTPAPIVSAAVVYVTTYANTSAPTQAPEFDHQGIPKSRIIGLVLGVVGFLLIIYSIHLLRYSVLFYRLCKVISPRKFNGRTAPTIPIVTLTDIPMIGEPMIIAEEKDQK